MRYTTNTFVCRPFRVLPRSFWPLFTTVCFCPSNLGPFTRHSFSFLPYPRGVYRPRGALCRKSSAENKVDGDAIKESGSFDERTEIPMEEATVYPLLFPTSWTHESLYTRVHTPLGRKKHDVGRRKIFRGLSVSFFNPSAASAG